LNTQFVVRFRDESGPEGEKKRKKRKKKKGKGGEGGETVLCSAARCTSSTLSSEVRSKGKGERRGRKGRGKKAFVVSDTDGPSDQKKKRGGKRGGSFSMSV